MRRIWHERLREMLGICGCGKEARDRSNHRLLITFSICSMPQPAVPQCWPLISQYSTKVPKVPPRHILAPLHPIRDPPALSTHPLEHLLSHSSHHLVNLRRPQKDQLSPAPNSKFQAPRATLIAATSPSSIRPDPTPPPSGNNVHSPTPSSLSTSSTTARRSPVSSLC
jgi:hypothetical protein